MLDMIENGKLNVEKDERAYLSIEFVIVFRIKMIDPNRDKILPYHRI